MQTNCFCLVLNGLSCATFMVGANAPEILYSLLLQQHCICHYVKFYFHMIDSHFFGFRVEMCMGMGFPMGLGIPWEWE